MSSSVDRKKVLFALFSVAFGLFAAIYGQPLIHGNEQAISVIVTVFAILAGSLVAIIAVTGDPMLFSPGTWRLAQVESEQISNRLIRHKWLFFLYLITLGLIFLSILTKTNYPGTSIWLERVYLFFCTTAFIWSLCLPFYLIKIQKERIANLIKLRRKEAGIKGC